MSLPRKEIQKELENIFEKAGEPPAVRRARDAEARLIDNIDKTKPPKPTDKGNPKIIKTPGGTGYRRV
jgi:hypothetical protein